MKYLLLFFFLFIAIGVSAQQEMQGLAKDTTRRISTETDGVWREWNPIDSAWMTGEYRAILKKFKLKMDCEHCERILMHVEMKIDSAGKLSSYEVVKSSKCGEDFDKELQEAFMEYFYGITFPAIFRRTIFAALLGTGLKC